MQKGLGIAALVIAIVSIFIPFIGPWLTVLSALLAVFSLGNGFGLGIASIVINLVNVFVLSPTVWLAISANTLAASQGKSLLSVGMILFSVQAVAGALLIMLNMSKKNKARGLN